MTMELIWFVLMTLLLATGTIVTPLGLLFVVAVGVKLWERRK